MASSKALTKRLLTPSVFEDFFRPWNEWFDNGDYPARVLTVPAVNVTENPDHYLVSLAAPGLSKDDFNIDIEGNLLTISSEKEEEKEEKNEKYTRKEYSYTGFSRSFNLPEDVKSEMIDARYMDGILSISLPRKVESTKTAASRKIAVK